MPAPQAVQVYDEVSRRGEVDLHVVYLQRMSYERSWTDEHRLEHSAVFLPSWRPWRQLYVNRGLLTEYFRFRPDLVIVQGYYAPAMQLAMLLATAFRRPWVFWAEIPHVRFHDAPIVPHPGLRRLLRGSAMWALRTGAPREIWTMGERAVDAYRDVCRARVPVRNLPYHQDYRPFYTAGQQRRRGDRVRFLYAGGLNRRKGADLVAAAAATLLEEGRSFDLHIAGSGPLEPAIDVLQFVPPARLVRHGFMQFADVPTVFSQADVLLYPSRHDGWGHGVLEGLAAAMPVITTATTGAADALEDGICGVRMKTATETGLADAMRMFIDRPALVDKMGSAGPAVAARFGHDVGAQRFGEHVRRVLQGLR